MNCPIYISQNMRIKSIIEFMLKKFHLTFFQYMNVLIDSIYFSNMYFIEHTYICA